MNKGDKIFLGWGIVLFGLILVMVVHDYSSERIIESVGVYVTIGEFIGMFTILVIIPYFLYRVIRSYTEKRIAKKTAN